MLPPRPRPRPLPPSLLLLLCCCLGRGAMGAPAAPQEELGSRVPVTDAQVRVAAETAVESFNGAAGGHLYRLARVKMAWCKDLPGGPKRYHLVFDIKETECERKGSSRLAECSFRPDNVAMLGVCHGDVDFIPGKEATAVGNPTCQMKKPILEETLVTRGSGCSGCAVPVPKEEAQAAVDAALKVFNSANARHKQFAVKSIDRATKEVVVGLRFHVEFSVQETSCSSQNSSSHGGPCSLEPVGTATMGRCKAEVAFGVGESEGRVRGFPVCQLTSPVTEEVPAASAPCTGCPVPLRPDDPAVWLAVRATLPVLGAAAANASLPQLAPALVLAAERHTAVGDEMHVKFTVLQGSCGSPEGSVKPACEFSVGGHLISGICKVQQKRNAQLQLSLIALACNVSRDNETSQLISRSAELKDNDVQKVTIMLRRIAKKKKTCDPGGVARGCRLSQGVTARCHRARPQEAISINATGTVGGAPTGGSIPRPGHAAATATTAADHDGKFTEHLGLDVTDISHALLPAPSDPALTDFDLLDALG